MGLELISKAIEIDNKCDFAYETMGTIEVQRSVFKDLKYCSILFYLCIFLKQRFSCALSESESHIYIFILFPKKL